MKAIDSQGEKWYLIDSEMADDGSAAAEPSLPGPAVSRTGSEAKWKPL